MHFDAARRAIRRGAIAGFILVGLALAASLWSMRSDAANTFAWLQYQELKSAFGGPWQQLPAVVLFTALSIGVWRRSRIAAMSLIVFFVLQCIIACLYMGKLTGRWYPWIPGLVIVALFLYFFAKAAQGTFVYHKRRRRADPTYRATPRWAYWLWIPAFVAILAGIALHVLAAIVALGPATIVLSIDDLRSGDLELLRSREIVSPDEEVLYFYSAGLFSILEDGNVLTDKRVISYETDESELSTFSATFDEISAIWVEQEGSVFSDTLVALETIDGTVFYLLLSPEGGGDKVFLNALRAKVAEAKP